MTCAIMQPTYLPWLGYFDLIAKSDIFVIFDSVQYEKRSWQVRNRIRNNIGEIMLTVPVKYGGYSYKKINNVEIEHSSNTLSKHLKTIQHSYSKSINYNLIIPSLESIYNTNPKMLMDLNILLIKFGMDCLKINTQLIYSSELDVQGSKVEALIDICKKVNADHYYSPIGSKTYIDENNLFEKNNIELTYQNYDHPIYQQLNYPNFISHLSFIDYLFNQKI